MFVKHVSMSKFEKYEYMKFEKLPRVLRHLLR